MAWTSLTYSFLSVLTSAKMTQNQDNFTALAQGLSGAPAILKAALPASVAYEDEANTFTAGIQRKNSGDDRGIRLARFEVDRGGISWNISDDLTKDVLARSSIEIILADDQDTSPNTVGIVSSPAGSSTRSRVFEIGVTDGKITAGIVPLARITGTTYSGSPTVNANTVSSQSLAAISAVHRYFLHSAYVPSSVAEVSYGADVTEAEAVRAQIHTFIVRGASTVDRFVIVNGTASNQTVNWEVRQLIQT